MTIYDFREIEKAWIRKKKLALHRKVRFLFSWGKRERGDNGLFITLVPKVLNDIL